MKKFTVPQLLKMFVILLVGFTLSSCSLDNPDIPPVKLENLPGNYKGRLITIQGEIKKESIRSFKVKKDTITFEEFPINEIVKTVVKDPVKAEAALKALGKVKYNLQYKASINTPNNVLELVFAPETLTLQIPVDGTTKKTVVTLAAKQKGFYVGMDGSLRFSLIAEKITVDDAVLNPYEAINYNFPFCIKS
ncbi:DUF4840 domain-containing protein [Chryseobacterium pennipullorum]|uniref:DUF4840 domain-containing protein n=1 Tax=Chryseobacterium pennipullorum TaxID=2258963 RepID=A0A3D9AQB4_9FLAO|nr:DUF4840 domain-containing protein [Chryseobacterium pennipullorum]REC43513.1 DUF4840 domain-containing protein [Chryseobacterium pennipullorum]